MPRGKPESMAASFTGARFGMASITDAGLAHRVAPFRACLQGSAQAPAQALPGNSTGS
jgi:hypothetical protein